MNIYEILEKAINVTQLSFNKRNYTSEEFKNHLIANFKILAPKELDSSQEIQKKLKEYIAFLSSKNKIRKSIDGIYLCKYDINHITHDIYIRPYYTDKSLYFPLNNGLTPIKTHDYRGQYNTNLIKKTTNKSLVCDDSFKNNWYLPSKVELNLVYKLKDVLIRPYPQIFKHTYWTSSLVYTGNHKIFQAWCQCLTTGEQKLYRLDMPLKYIAFKSIPV
ncbi:MAG: hypothetical protein ACOC33_01895 [bacterium]